MSLKSSLLYVESAILIKGCPRRPHYSLLPRVTRIDDGSLPHNHDLATTLSAKSIGFIVNFPIPVLSFALHA